MTTELVHFSALPTFPVGVVSRRQKPDGALKPEGLWVSVEGGGDGWSDWCRSEQYGLDGLAYAHRVTLAEGANILTLSDAAQIDEFTATYSLLDAQRASYRIDWRAVAAKHQGILISPYVWERRLSLHASWYYTWDCASGCIWNRAAVASVEVIEPAAVGAR